MGAGEITSERGHMAYRLTFSSRAVREIGAAKAWYESQCTGLGEEFVAAIELQLIRLQQEPLIYAEVIPRVRRALAPRFPYGLFYTVKRNLIHVLSVMHVSRHPDRWPKSR